MKKVICLKVDVDTYNGTKKGLPVLLKIFKEFKLQATFFVSLGPDNSGKALKNIFTQKGFFKKMIRTRAWKLYGLRTIFSGALFPPRYIGEACSDIIKSIEESGHEAGVHAWDHRLWQDNLDLLSESIIFEELKRAFSSFKNIFKHHPQSTAAPGWHCNDKSLSVLEQLALTYSSDTRGRHGDSPFFPVYNGLRFNVIQIPTTLPCAEELISAGSSDIQHVYTALFKSLDNGLNIVPIHAEVEGGMFSQSFREFIRLCKEAGYSFLSIKDMLSDIKKNSIPTRKIVHEHLPGRSGLVSRPI